VVGYSWTGVDQNPIAPLLAHIAMAMMAINFEIWFFAMVSGG
jgi:hypothetical protein